MSTTGEPAKPTEPVRSSGYAVRAHRTRERLIDHATQRILHDGFTNVRMEDLAEELGMGKSTIYRNFPSKDELLEAVLDKFQIRIASLVRAVCKDTHNWQERAASLTKTISTELQGVTTTALEDIRKNRPDQYRKLSRYRRRILSEQIEVIVREGQ